MSQYVETPQGVVEFPDGMDQTQIAEALNNHFNPQPTTLQDYVVNPVKQGKQVMDIAATDLGRRAGLYSNEEAAKRNVEDLGEMAKAAPSKKLQAKLDEIDEAGKPKEEDEGWSDAPIRALAAYARNPSVVGPLVLQSLVSSVPMLGAGVVGSIAGPVGGAAGAGLASYQTEYANTILEAFREKNIDVTDPKALAAAYGDPEVMDYAARKANARGIPIGAFDALSFGIAGLPYKAISRGGGRVSKVAGGLGEAGVQATLGGSGEATAQLADKGKITDYKGVIDEAIGEIVPGAAAAALKAARSGGAPVAPTEAPPPAPQGAVDRIISPEGNIPPPEAPPGSPQVPAGENSPEGQRVYDHIVQKLWATDMPKQQAIEEAKVARVIYETAGTRMGTDAWTEFQRDKISDIRSGTPNSMGVLEQGLGQDVVGHDSLLRRVLVKPKINTNTAQGWMNYLKNNGVKDEELEWSGLGDWLYAWKERHPGKRLASDDVRNAFVQYPVQTYTRTEAPKDEDYRQYTMGGYGLDPKSNYREVIISEGNPDQEPRYRSAHFGGIPNPVAHYRATDRTTPDGKSLMMVEEIQSDWHQAAMEKNELGDRRGYRGKPEDMLKARTEVDRLQDEYEAALKDPNLPSEDKVGMGYTLRRAYDRLDEQTRGLIHGLPDSPFKESWHNLTFRHALLDAIQNDKDYLAWSTGEQQTDRWWDRENPDYKKKLHGFQEFYDRTLVNYANKLGKQFGAKVEPMEVESPVEGATEDVDWMDLDGGITFNPPGEGVDLPASWEAIAERFGERVATHVMDERLAGEDSGTFRVPVEKKEGVKVWALQITPKMREFAANSPFNLFQTMEAKRAVLPGEPGGERVAQVNFKGPTQDSDRQAIILLGKGAPAGAFLHELMHIRLESMRRDAPNNPEIAHDLKVLLDWLGLDSPHKIKAEHHEQVARGFEQFLRNGKAPTNALKEVFAKMAAWLREVYAKAADLRVRLSPEAKKVYERMLGGARVEGPSMPVKPPTGMGPMMGGFYREAPQQLGQEQTLGKSLLEHFQGSRAGRAWGKVSDPLGNLPDKKNYMISRMRTQGKADEINKFAEKMVKDLPDDPKQMQAVYDFLTTRNANPASITDPKVRAAAQQVKNKVNQISAELVRAGKIDVHSAANFHDRYLPRLYLKFLIEKKGMKASGIKIGNEGYTRQRKNLTLEERRALGEVKDPKYLAYVAMTRPLRDLAVNDMMTEVANNPEWTWQGSLVNWQGKMVTPYWLQAEAADIRERAALEPDNQAKNHMSAIATQMEAAAAQNNPNQDYDHKDFTKIPNTRSYGQLRGAVVRKEIAADIKGMESFADPNNFMERWLGDRGSVLVKANQLWKEAKVVWNPPTQVRNFVSNLMLLHLSGVPFHRQMMLLPRAAKEILRDGKYWQIAKKYGIDSSTMTESELKKETDKFLKNLQTSSHGPVRSALGAPMKALGALREFAREGYQLSEQIGKVMKIMDAMEHDHLNEADAALEANKWLFDYSLVSPSVRYLRNAPMGMPFLCVDTDTEILTQRGWLRHDQVIVGDMAASFDMGDEHLKWKPVVDIYRAPYDGDMVHIKDRHLDMLMTPDHRVVTYRNRRTPGERGTNGKHPSLEIQLARNLTTADHIPVAAPFIHDAAGEPISDAMAEFLGWYVSEGSAMRNCKAIFLHQNEGPKADKIRTVLRKVGFTWRENYRLSRGYERVGGQPRNIQVAFYVHARWGKMVRAICPDKKLSPEMVMRMTVPQLMLFLDAFIAGDGSTCKKTGRQVIIQKDEGTLNALQMALSITGRSYGVYRRTEGCSSIQIRDLKKYCVKRGRKGMVQFSGEIWCPKVADTATWVARRNGKVFITHNTFTTKVIPLLAETAMTPRGMFRLGGYYLLAQTLPYLVAGMNDIDEDDVDRLRKSLSERLQKRGDLYLLPYKDESNRWQFVDVGYFFPWQQITDFARNISSGDLSDAARSVGVLSSPVVSALTAATTGIDSFTGNPIMDKRDPPREQIGSLMSYIWGLVAPPAMTEYGALGKWFDRQGGTGLNRYGEPGLTDKQIAARAFGVNVTPVIPDAQRARNLLRMQYEIDQEKTRMNQKLRDQSLSKERREETIQRYRDDMIRRYQKMQEYIKESTPTPKLSAATARRDQ